MTPGWRCRAGRRARARLTPVPPRPAPGEVRWWLSLPLASQHRRGGEECMRVTREGWPWGAGAQGERLATGTAATPLLLLPMPFSLWSHLSAGAWFGLFLLSLLLAPFSSSP
eukprot:scaffold4907_cov122-Isochrysis_galbana.AAC.15